MIRESEIRTKHFVAECVGGPLNGRLSRRPVGAVSFSVTDCHGGWYKLTPASYDRYVWLFIRYTEGSSQ